MLPRLLALAASAASLAPQPQRALPTTLQRQAATAALAGAVVASPLAAVALSVDVTDINSPPVVDLPVLGRFGVSPSKAKPTGKVSGDLVGTALSAKDGKVKVTVSTPKIGPLPALDDEVLDIRIASSPGTVAVTISNPAIPKLPVGGGTSDWNVVQNLGSGATYYFNSKTGVTQYANPVAPSPKPAKRPSRPPARGRRARRRHGRRRQGRDAEEDASTQEAAPPKREKVKGRRCSKASRRPPSPKKAAAKKAESVRLKPPPPRTEEAAGPAPSAPKIEPPRKTKRWWNPCSEVGYSRDKATRPPPIHHRTTGWSPPGYLRGRGGAVDPPGAVADAAGGARRWAIR